MDDSDLKSRILDKTGDLAPVYSEDFIRKYIAYTRLYCKPELQESAMKRMVDGYMSIKESYPFITVRVLETIPHLSEAMAKTRLKDVVEETDVLKGISIVERYLANDANYRDTANDPPDPQ